MQKPYERITSRQNALVSLAVKLAERKHREREGLFRFDGKKLFLEALEKGVELVAVLLRESSAEKLLSAVGDWSPSEECRTVLLPDDLFERVSQERAPEGVICLARCLDNVHESVTIDAWREAALWENEAHVLFLESVRDPGNLGTIVRAGCAFGVSAIVLSEDCADIYNPRVLRAAMGTLFTQPIFVTSDLSLLVREYAKHKRVFAATLSERSVKLGRVALLPGDAALIGNEGHGLSDAVISAATDEIYIPMEAGVESLNAGVAASVLLWEFYRGQGHE